MDQCAGALLAFPPQGNLAGNGLPDNEAYHRAVVIHTQQLARLRNTQARDLVSFSTELFNVIDPAVNSLSYLTLLHALLLPSPVTEVPQDFVLEKLVTFMMTFDGQQCRYAGTLLLDIMDAVGNGRVLPPSVAVETLASAILRLDPSGSILTSSHILLANLAYNTDNIPAALPVIDKDIVFFPGMANHEVAQHPCDLQLSPPSYISRSTGLTAQLKSSMVLEYDLLCGMMYCARRDWGKSCAAFERVVTFPTKDSGCSRIMVDAFKKWILVSMLSEGKPRSTPAYVSSATTRTFIALGRPYISLASAFITDDARQLKQEADENKAVWIEDGNVGLVEEVVASYQQWRVLSLQDIYTKISTPEIRQQTKSAETGAPLQKDEDVEALVQNMIIEGMLKGVVEKNDDGTKFLVFLSPTTHLSEQQFAEVAQRTSAKLKELKATFVATNQRLGTGREYIRWIVKESRRDKNSEAVDPTLGFEGQFDAQIEDEDLMVGVSNP
ncbi:hypothetical protein F4777DRAFT_534849 [Nemania sp. FL0916]|nr:hypothetical protein F4777DRAFT_534849 [Nemania sp. FL0916]